MITRPPLTKYDPNPPAEQLANRKKYQKTVDAVAHVNAIETRDLLQRQADEKRFDSSVLVFGEAASSTWKSVPVPPSRLQSQTPDPVVLALGFENPEQQDNDRYDGIDLDTHHEEAHSRHNSMMCLIDHLETIDAQHSRKSTRPIKSHAEATRLQKKSSKTPMDKRVLQLEQASEACFNEEMKMKSINHDALEHFKWLHCRTVQHTVKMFISAMATLNQNGSNHEDNARMLDMLKHQSELSELYLTAIIVRDCPDISKRMGIKVNTTIPARCKRLIEISHEVHRILVSAPGSSKMFKLGNIGRVFAMELLSLRDVFNEWDKKQVMQFSRLTRSISVTGLMPFTQAPTPAQIEAARVHAATLKEDEKREIISTYRGRLSCRGGNGNHDDNEIDNDNASSVSSSGSSSGSESLGSVESRERMVAEIRRAQHETPFIAGGKVMYAPRRPHTKGSRALTGMELDIIPLVTGARDSVEHATSLSSPRRKPHPSWEPHVELEEHPTFGNKYHGHHLHVHHNHHGNDWKEKAKNRKKVDEHGHPIHKHHHHRHRSGGGGHHHQHRKHPKTLKECILSHETDVSVLLQAYKTEALKFPPSWKDAADKAEKNAQQVQILKDQTPVEVQLVERAHGSHHNVYELEAHGKPATKHRVYQELVSTAKKSMQNKMLTQFSASSYKKVLALNLHQRSVSARRQRRVLDQACKDETVRNAHLVVQGRRAQARTRVIEREKEEQKQARLVPGRRPNTAFSQAVRIPGFSDIQMANIKRQKHEGFVDGHREPRVVQTARSARSATCRPASTTPTISTSMTGGGSKVGGSHWRSSGAQTPVPQRPERPQTTRTRSAATPRARMSVVLRQRQYDISATDVMKSAKSSHTWNKRLNHRWMNGRHTPADPDTSKMKMNKKTTTRSRPATSLGIHERPESRAEALHVATELDEFDKSLRAQSKSRTVNNMFRLRSGASKQVRRIKARKRAFGL